MNQRTTANSATIVAAPRGSRGNGQELLRPLEARAELTARGSPSELLDFAGDDRALLRATATARNELREVASAAVEAASRARAVATLLDEALAMLRAVGTASALASAREALPPGEPAGLSPRERDVLALVAEGRTNKAIAETLFVSPNTVKTHVTSLLNKLHADSRVQLATLAIGQNLDLHHRGASGAASDPVLL